MVLERLGLTVDSLNVLPASLEVDLEDSTKFFDVTEVVMVAGVADMGEVSGRRVVTGVVGPEGFMGVMVLEEMG